MLDNETIKRMQNKAFGKRYENTCMSQIDLPTSINKKVQKWLLNPKDILILSGTPGCGKTFLCSAIFNYFLNKQMVVNPGRNPFITAYREREFFREVRASGGEYYSEKLPRLLDYHMLIFDDFGSSGVTDWRKEVLFDVVNTRYESMLPTIITTNLSYHDIKTSYGERVSDRLFSKENVSVDMSKLDSKRI